MLNDVDAAIDATVEQRPAAFDKSDEAVPGTGTYKVLDERGLYQLLVYAGGGGTYKVCAENGACSEVVVEH